MRFGLLGPLEVEVEGRPVVIGSAMHRALLAVLLLRANRPVAQGALQAVLWGENPPATAAASLKNHVSRLRRILGDGTGERLRTVPSGYLFRVEDGELDTEEFRALILDGRDARARQDWSRVHRATSEALRLWRGTPLDDVPGEAVHLESRHLAEAHREMLEWHFDAAIRLGVHDGLAARLATAVEEHPLVETFSMQLMQVLHGSGRSAEALEVYQRLRRTLVDELGLEPSAQVQTVQRQILDASTGPEPTPASHPGPAHVPPHIPAHLPADLADFTGREAYVRDLCALLTPTDPANAAALPVCTITGMGGAGKTALAVHTAHRVKDGFPDGQLYIDLRGRDATPRTPDEVLGGFLRDLGVADQAALADQDAKAARYRTLTAGRRLLVVLDNARDAAQVRPLLPGSGSCAVLVTSRHKLPGLDGASHLDLDELNADEARTLLSRIIGQARIDAEPEATDAVLGFCAGLPLAVRIAGARLASRARWKVATLADRLADERRRLDELRLADVAVRSCFQVSYTSLEAPDSLGAGFPTGRNRDADRVDPARALRLLGLCGSSEISLPAAAALLGRSPDVAEEALEVLVDACLLDHPMPGRYRLHDLLRVYAAERAAEEEPEAEQVAAVERLARWTLAALAGADAATFPNNRRPELPAPDPDHPAPEFADQEAALAWFDLEAEALTATTAVAAARGLHTLAWLIPAFAMGFLRASCRYPEWAALNTIGLASARALGDREGEARMLTARSSMLLQLNQPDEAEVCIRAALYLRRAMGDAVGELAQLSNLGIVYERQGRDELARSHYEDVLALARKIGRRSAEANVLNNLATVEDRLGNYDAALSHLAACRAVWRELDDPDGESFAQANIGAVLLHRGDFAQALACLEEVLPVTRSFGNRIGEAENLTHQGQALEALGRHAEARERLQQAGQLWKELGDPQYEEVTAALAAAEAR
ncbi:AfsR/SARP family transcriptional regulator [Catenulispora subtropica]|uniref:BTAD domain-containing putative transcriptional regulator n=1 Tax=Catenulispora subtropica TaxID=450798 RepID=A0ABP5CNF6_9ACTN